MRAAMSAQLQTLAANWALRRQGRDPLNLTLRRRRIYILPTRFGTILACLVFAMLLGSMNYGASLGFALTFLLTGLGLVTMHHCHNNLLATELRFAGAQPVFAGEAAEFRIALTNRAGSVRHELELERGKQSAGPIDLAPGDSEPLTLRVGATRRGWLELGRFSVVTRHPGALFRAWTWVHMDARCLVYPAPAPAGRPLPQTESGQGRQSTADRGDADFAGLRTAVPGDPPARIAWKAYARNDELLIKQFSGGDQSPSLLDWDALPDLDVEAKLAQLTRWCLDAADQYRSFGLRIPGAVVPLGSGHQHLHECLRVLALFDGTSGR